MTDEDITRALAAAREDRTPPPELEAATIEALRSRALIGGRRRTRRRAVFIQIAALAAAVLVGVWIGQMRSSRPAPSGSRFVLLLYLGAEYQATDAAGDAAREAEYGAWIRSLARAGHATMGEKLAWGGIELRPNRRPVELTPVPTPEAARGFFIIVAADEQAALAIAETCPHLKYGGRVVVRPIS
jgi:hypothetical protein